MKYFSRAFKYLISLCVVYLAVIYLMSLTGMSIMTPSQTLQALYSSQRGIIMVIAILALSISYPVFGFMRKEISGDLVKNREAIINSLAVNGFKLKSESRGEMLFESSNFLKKFTFLFEDEIVISQVGDKLVVEGIRRGVALIIYRLESAIESSEE